MPEIGIVGVHVLIRGQLLRIAGRSHFVSVGRNNQPMQPLHAVVVLDELGSQIVQQRLIAGTTAQEAEVARDTLYPFAEVPLPDAIDNDAREERIILGEPINESFAPALMEVCIRRLEGKAGIDWLIFLGTLRIAR